MNGDFDLFVLNGKIKELNEKISSINSSIDSIKTEFDDLNIGNPTDTGGSQTAGTVMAKENAIMQMMKDYGSQVKNNMILKQTPQKAITEISANKWPNVEFEFDKPVRIVGIRLSFTLATAGSQFNIPVYIINGEDSFTARIISDRSSVFAVLSYISNSDLAFWGLYQNVHPIPSDIWATRLSIQVGSYAKTGSTVYAYVVYQEEG